jgi:hypothetical protein
MEIEKQIIDQDGSVRDINIDNIDVSKACALAEHLYKNYSLSSAFTGDGRDVLSLIASPSLRSAIFEKEKSNVDLFWQNPENLIRDLKLFFEWNKRGDIFVELTFFPEEIDTETFNLDLFMGFLKPIIKISDTQQFYVRYENASWEYGDVSQYSGVIFYNLDAQKVLKD